MTLSWLGQRTIFDMHFVVVVVTDMHVVVVLAVVIVIVYVMFNCG